MDQYKIQFSVKDANKTVIFNKEFPELKGAFDWAEWFIAKHDWVNDYIIKPLIQKIRRRKKSK